MSLHHFEIHVAQKYGINVATFLNNLAYWTELNIANQTNFNDGTWWSRKTQDAFRILFPYWSRQNIRTIIQKCLSENLIITGNYNKNQYDKTNWYTFTEKGWNLFPRLQTAVDAIGENQPIEGIASTNQVAETNQPIQDNAFINTKNKKSSCASPKKSTEQKPKAQEQVPEGHFLGGLGLSQRQQNEKRHDFAGGMTRQAEARSTVPDFGPGHPTWESQQSWKRQWEEERKKNKQLKETSHGTGAGTDGERFICGVSEKMLLAEFGMA